MGDVNITILDGGASIAVPVSTTQLVLGVCALSKAATPVSTFQIVATTNPSTLYSYVGPGPLAEAGGLSALAGGTVLAIPLPVTTKGTATAPVLSQGTGASLGTVGASGITTTLDSTYGAYDDYYVQVAFPTGGTVSTAGIQFQLSLDAGRTFGPVLNLGTSATYIIPNTGITLNFGAGTIVAGNVCKFSTVAPAPSDADINTAIGVYKASPYALAGVGTIHIVGVYAGTDIALMSNGSTGYLDVLKNQNVYNRAIISVRDAGAPAAWGGSGESEPAWMTAIETNASSTITGNDGKRLSVNAGYYNTPTAFPTTVCGTPSYRRPLSWSLAARQVIIPPQRHAGRVKDGALSTIVVNPSSDPTDGFIYHDERIKPGLDAARFSSATTRLQKGAGFFIKNPNLMSLPGSVFTILPLGLVMDVACTIVFAVGQNEIDDDIRTLPSGTLYPSDALALQNAFDAALQADMVSQNMLSSEQTVVDQTNNVALTSTVNVGVTLQARGYVLKENITIGYTTGSQAGG